MKNLFLLTFTIAIIFSLTSCFDSVFCKQGTGKVIVEERKTENFSTIIFNLSGDLYIKQSDTVSITVEAQENLLNEIKTDVGGDVLEIYTNRCIKSDDPVKIFVSVPKLWEIESNGSGNIYQNGFWNFNHLRNTLNGSGNIELNNVQINKNLYNKNNGSGNIILNNINVTNTLSNIIVGSGDIIGKNIISTQNTKAEITGSGYISISSDDTCNLIEISITGSGNLNKADFPANNVKITSEGSGDVFVSAIEKLEAEIIGSGDIFYTGNPVINLTKTGSGNLINDN